MISFGFHMGQRTFAHEPGGANTLSLNGTFAGDGLNTLRRAGVLRFDPAPHTSTMVYLDLTQRWALDLEVLIAPPSARDYVLTTLKVRVSPGLLTFDPEGWRHVVDLQLGTPSDFYLNVVCYLSEDYQRAKTFTSPVWPGDELPAPGASDQDLWTLLQARRRQGRG